MPAMSWLAVALACSALAGLAPAASAAERTRLKVCAYNVERNVTVEVDGDRFARLPQHGSCETRSISRGSHRIDISGDANFSSGEVLDPDGGRDAFYSLPVSVRVEAGERTRVNLYLF